MSNKGPRRRGGMGRNSQGFNVSASFSPSLFPTYPSWNMMQRQQQQQQQQAFPDMPNAAPPVPFSFYDRFSQEALPAAGFREGFTGEFGSSPTFWSPDTTTLFTGPPNADRFRPNQGDSSWPRPAAWKDSEAPWPDRPEPFPLPRTPQWTRNAPQATRMFEPSDNWKQTHGERPRGRDHYSPSQPVAESQRYRPYSPTRNRLYPPLNPRSDSYRPVYDDDWQPDDTDPYDSTSRGSRGNRYHSRSPTPDRKDRHYRGRGSERSVSPASSRSRERSSSPYGPPPPPPPIPKRESPELPHLESLPGDSSQGIPIPLSATSPVPPRSPSDSSSVNSGVLPHQQPKSQQDTLSQSASSTWPSASTSSGLPKPSGDLPPKPIQMVQPKKGQGRHTLGRRSYFHNAPAFVASTLAIDAPLMYPAVSKNAPRPPNLPPKPVQDDARNVYFVQIGRAHV